MSEFQDVRNHTGEKTRIKYYVKWKGSRLFMPRIVGTQLQQIRIESKEVKGRDFYTFAGKSEKILIQNTQNVPMRPSSFRAEKRTRGKGPVLLAALSLGALAYLPRASAGPGNQALMAESKTPKVKYPTNFSLKPASHSTLLLHLPIKKISLPPPTSKPYPVVSNNYYTEKSTPLQRMKNATRPSIALSSPLLKIDRLSSPPGESTRPPNAKRREQAHSRRLQLDRDAKAQRNRGDEQYWTPIVAEPPAEVATPLPSSTNATRPLSNALPGQWQRPLQDILTFLHDSPPLGYDSLPENRLSSARILFRHEEQGQWADEPLLNYVNEKLDPDDDAYYFPLARKIIRHESLLYYVKYEVLNWDLNPTARDFESRFLEAHLSRGKVFTPEQVIKFYNNQFMPRHSRPAEPFKSREKLCSLEKYYSQFNDYLKNHAVDDSVRAVEQTVAFQLISPLDLERPFTPLFSLRTGAYRSELLPQTAQRVETLKLGAFIFILQGDSGKCYAASMWGSVLLVADLSEVLTDTQVETIAGLQNGGRVPPENLKAQSLLTALWPDYADIVPDAQQIIVRFDREIKLGMEKPTLGEALIHIQHTQVKRFVDAWRTEHLDRSLLEKILSFVPFFDVIQRKINDAEYRPTLKELAFDLFDLGLALLSLGIPMIKLGASGIKAGLMAMRAGRTAGLAGQMLQRAILVAIKPALKKLVKASGKEIASFMVPPFDLMRLLHRPLRKGVRKLYKTSKTRRLRRCPRAIGGACVPRTENIYGFDNAEWERLVTELIMHPSAWRGNTLSRGYRHDYVRRFMTLSTDQKEALRGWSFVPKQKEYRNYPRKRSWPSGKSNLNFSLNLALLSGHPSAQMMRTSQHLKSALNALPKMPERQSLVRVVDITEENISQFRAGEIVTNYPAFMSASSKGKLVNIALSQGWMFDPSWRLKHNAAIAIYYIDADSSKPLINRLTTQVNMEGEYIFDQKSFFRIEAITRLFMTSPTRSYKQAYFIKLQEVPYDSAYWIKNIFTGDVIRF
ncbi:MAG: hypothetical protein WCB03_17180 [Rouxiella badensis]|uniref:hypothetical protein n=1 Tax=Rouxiella badensis TaxID=1646377 RepID=UPI003C665735